MFQFSSHEGLIKQANERGSERENERTNERTKKETNERTNEETNERTNERSRDEKSLYRPLPPNTTCWKKCTPGKIGDDIIQDGGRSELSNLCSRCIHRQTFWRESSCCMSRGIKGKKLSIAMSVRLG